MQGFPTPPATSVGDSPLPQLPCFLFFPKIALLHSQSSAFAVSCCAASALYTATWPVHCLAPATLLVPHKSHTSPLKSPGRFELPQARQELASQPQSAYLYACHRSPVSVSPLPGPQQPLALLLSELLLPNAFVLSQ